MAEAGVKGFDIDSWMGIFTPAKTPPEVVAKLRSEIRAILPALKEPYDKVGGVVLDIPDAEVGPFIQREHDMWTKVIKDAGIKLD
jgi:tripartite-type tricarboxylate transporter receptor subunit TctC